MNLNALWAPLRARLLAGLACLPIALLAACSASDQPEAAAPPPPQVGVVTAQPVNVPLVRDVVGRLSAFRSADVHARVAGILLERAYVEGSEVRKGQLLFRIDPQPLKAAFDAASAQLAKDEALLAQARTNLKRYESLLREKAVAEQTVLDQRFLVEQQQATVKLDQARVETARIDLGYASVTAPIAGRAGQQQVTEGALVGQGAPTLLTTVSQLDPLYVNFTMSVGELNALRAAAQRGAVQLSDARQTSVRVALPDGTPYPHAGLLDFSAPTVDPATASVSLRAVLPNPESTLLPGSYVRLRLALGERHDAFVLPPAAVQRDITGTYVLLVDADDTVVHRNVVSPGMHGVDWIVTSGLRAGDRVIVSGLQAAQVGKKAEASAWQPPESGPDSKPDEQGKAETGAGIGATAASTPAAAGEVISAAGESSAATGADKVAAADAGTVEAHEAPARTGTSASKRRR